MEVVFEVQDKVIKICDKEIKVINTGKQSYIIKIDDGTINLRPGKTFVFGQCDKKVLRNFRKYKDLVIL